VISHPEPLRLRVLLVEDDEDDFIITRGLLADIRSADYALDWVSNFAAAQAEIRARRHDVYLVDYRLGPFSGVDLLREAISEGCAAPIILLTGIGDHNTDQAAMRAGAADYLVKGQISAPLLERSINHSLERKQTERKLLESEAQLRQSQKMESIGTLAGGIAHDFNNLLGIITGYTDKLKTVPLSEADRLNSIHAIEVAASRGAGLVRQILTFARKTEISLEAAQVNDIVRELSRMIAVTFPKTIVVSLKLDPNIAPLLVDANQLQQSLLNLCVNARDAMPQGGSLTLETSMMDGGELSKRFPEAECRPYASVSVTDTGIGMDETIRARVFEPFFSTKGLDRGTGLGLAVVYGIVNNHKGHIEVESSPGKGSTFRIYLPVSPNAPISSEVEPLDLGRETSARPDQGPILFVEDEELLLELTVTTLESHGYEVLSARNGLEALEIFKRERSRIQLVLSDLGLPKLGGLELLQQIKSLAPGVRMIITTGYVPPEVRSKLSLAGAAEILEKPYKIGDLLKAVTRQTLR
jgi:two-component system cell cycle sensor histidine kinase/response regulator CckA